MAKTRLNSVTLSGFEERLAKLTAESERQFGTMTPEAMLRHMRNVMEAGIGEVTYPHVMGLIRGRILFVLFCHIITAWPKGKIKAPEFWTPPAEEDFARERELLGAALKRFVEATEKEPDRVVRNPFFGNLKLKEWTLLNGLHLNFHFKQFGV